MEAEVEARAEAGVEVEAEAEARAEAGVEGKAEAKAGVEVEAEAEGVGSGVLDRLCWAVITRSQRESARVADVRKRAGRRL